MSWKEQISLKHVPRKMVKRASELHYKVLSEAQDIANSLASALLSTFAPNSHKRPVPIALKSPAAKTQAAYRRQKNW